MRTLLSLLASLLVGCEVRDAHLADGTHLASVSWGGKTYEHYGNKNGGTTYTARDDHEKSFSDGALAAVSAVGLIQTGLSNRANTASDTAIAVSANKTASQQAATAAQVETARINAATKVAATIPR